MLNPQDWRQVGARWVQALAEHDFGQLVSLCQPDVQGRLLTPRTFDTVDGAEAVALKFQQWFGKSDPIRVEHAEAHLVGDTLSLSYRLLLREHAQWFEIEQWIAGSMKGGAICGIDLLCSGFHPASPPVDALTADAFLVVNASEGQGSTCAVLTPAIRMKLREMSSGQLLKVQVDDSTAKGDIEAWCRLSGNELLAVTAAESGPGSCFYLKKK